MAGEIQYRHDQTAENLYATLMDPTDGTYWDVANTGWETLVVASWGDYDVALTETPASSYKYIATMPALGADKVLVLHVYRRLGASPAITDPLLASRMTWWNNGAGELHDLTPMTTGTTIETYTVTRSDTGAAIAGATVWMTTAIGGTGIIATTTSDASGKAYLRHNLASGTTVYIWRYHPDYSFTNPDTETTT